MVEALFYVMVIPLVALIGVLTDRGIKRAHQASVTR